MKKPKRRQRPGNPELMLRDSANWLKSHPGVVNLVALDKTFGTRQRWQAIQQQTKKKLLADPRLGELWAADRASRSYLLDVFAQAVEDIVNEQFTDGTRFGKGLPTTDDEWIEALIGEFMANFYATVKALGPNWLQLAKSAVS
jgi:hypothetical protein